MFPSEYVRQPSFPVLSVFVVFLFPVLSILRPVSLLMTTMKLQYRHI